MSEKISAIIITLNEEKNIGGCLKAVSQVADEIIVVDSYSTDNTRAICAEYGTRFIENKFIGYIEQKDFARSLATHELILSVDADEILSDELIHSINEVKINTKYDAFTINRLSFYVDRFIYHGHWFPDKKIRLFRKDSGEWGGRNPHDQFVLNKNVKAPMLKGVIYHYTFNSITEHIAQANKFSDIGACELSGSNIFFLSLKALLSPIWGFFYGYFLKLGFLDGWYGLTIAVISSMESYLKYSKAIVRKGQKTNTGLSIMHLSSITKWRGGEQQVVNLVEQLRSYGIYNHLVVSKNSELSKYCINNKIDHTTINYANGFNFLAARKIKVLSKRHNIDIVHMHCSPSHTMGVFANLLGNKPKLVLTRRVIFPIKPNTLSLKKYNYPAIERIICVSHAIRGVLGERIKQNDKLEVIYDGVDLSKMTSKKEDTSIREEYDLRNKVIVTIIAALSPEKDHITFLDTAKILIKKNKEFHFLIVGAGGEEKNIREYIKGKGLSSDVTMTGFRGDIPNILMESDYFLMTSRMEGLGSSIIEAFANNVPVVATNVGGIPELVIHGKTGLLAAVGDSKEIANHIIHLHNNPEVRSTLIENASSHLNQNLRIETTAKKTEDVYRELVSTEI